MKARKTPIEPLRNEVGACYWRTGEGREYFFREPTLLDGADLWRMARETGGLDLNSPYSYLMLAGHFADTCVVAERARRPVGFLSAFIRPAAPDTVFVWQIAVTGNDRGRGLGSRLLHQLLSRPACRRVETLEATVAASNRASRALFKSVARALGAPFRLGQGLESGLFPGGAHESEDLVRIGPLPPQRRGLRSRGDENHEPANDRFAGYPARPCFVRSRGHRRA